MKKKLGIESDYALAQRLDLTKQAISQLRHREAVMSPTTAARVAVLLELDPMRVIADAELERGSDSQLWKKLRDALAALLVAIGAALFTEPAQAAFNINISAVSTAGTVSPSVYGTGGNAHRRLSDYTLHGVWRALLQAARALAAIARAALSTGGEWRTA